MHALQNIRNCKLGKLCLQQKRLKLEKDMTLFCGTLESTPGVLFHGMCAVSTIYERGKKNK